MHRIIEVSADLFVSAKILCALPFGLVVTLAGTVQIGPMGSMCDVSSLTSSDSTIYYIESDIDTTSIYQC